MKARHSRLAALTLLAGQMVFPMVRPSHAQELTHLVRELLEKNPAILAARRAVDAKRANVTPARTLPEPSVSYEHMGNLFPPTLQAGDPSSGRVLRFTQEFPFPGKLALQGQIAETEADAEQWRYEEIRREKVAELKTAYFDLFLAEKLAQVYEESKTLLLQFSEITQARYKVGQGAQQDVLKSQVEVSRLLDRLAVLQREKESAQALINVLLYRPPDTPVAAASNLPRPKMTWTLESLYEKSLGNNPSVLASRKAIERDELRVALAKKSFYPDFEVGFAHFNRNDMPEMYGLMFKAKIPLYFWRKQRPELESVTADLLGQRRQYENTLSTLYFRLKDPYLRAATNAELLDLYGDAIVPQARLALESSMSSYRVGTVDFLTLLSNQSTVLEYQTKYIETLADLYKALVTLEVVSGEVLTQ